MSSLLLHGHPSTLGVLRINKTIYSPISSTSSAAASNFIQGTAKSHILYKNSRTLYLQIGSNNTRSKKLISIAPRCSSSSNSNDSKDKTKTPFGYTRKDVLLIGLGVTFVGVGLKSGLEFAGVDPLQAGNVVQLVLVLGLTVGWISTYIFRVSNKEMTYAQQLRDYELKVMEKRLEGLTEAELEALLEQVEEEKRSQASGEQVN